MSMGFILLILRKKMAKVFYRDLWKALSIPASSNVPLVLCMELSFEYSQDIFI